MPRPKHGLGQGLDALVSSRQRPPNLSESQAPPKPSMDEAPQTVPVPERWEYACLLVGPKRKNGKRRLSIMFSYPEVTLKPRTQRIHGVDAWTALGLLGAQGWELVDVELRAFYLKRHLIS